MLSDVDGKVTSVSVTKEQRLPRKELHKAVFDQGTPHNENGARLVCESGAVMAMVTRGH